jgi:HSP20 family molecular chaperone IbpA
MANKEIHLPIDFDSLFDGDPFFGFFDRVKSIIDRGRAGNLSECGPGRPRYYANAEGTELFVELPGCKKEDISATVDAGSGKIVIHATREIAGKKDSYRLELTPDRGGIDADALKPSYVDGILTLHIKETSEVKKLSIE